MFMTPAKSEVAGHVGSLLIALGASFRLLGVISASFVLSLAPVASTGNAPSWIAQYGFLSGVVTSIVLIGFALFALKRPAKGRALLIWATPIIAVHNVMYLSISGQLALGTLVGSLPDFFGWLLLLICRKT